MFLKPVYLDCEGGPCGLHRRWLHIPLHRIVGKPTMVMVAVQGPPTIEVFDVTVTVLRMTRDYD